MEKRHQQQSMTMRAIARGKIMEPSFPCLPTLATAALMSHLSQLIHPGVP